MRDVPGLNPTIATTDASPTDTNAKAITPKEHRQIDLFANKAKVQSLIPQEFVAQQLAEQVPPTTISMFYEVLCRPHINHS